MKIKKILLLIIVIFAAIIRIYKIDSLPPPLFYDEADAGYQAMVFNQNHTDYYGNKFPIHFRSFGDYRTSLQIYSTALCQLVVHNPNISVRLPSAIFGVLSVVVIYLITSSIIPSFLLAISPWAIHYSRIGFEVSGMILCLLLGILFLQKFLVNKKIKNILLSVLFFCLSPYFYSTAKLYIILIIPVIIFLWRKEIFNLDIKKILLVIMFGTLCLFPMLKDTISGKSGFRFSYIGIFTLPHREQVVDTLRYQDALTDHPNQVGISTTLISSIFHNKYQLVLQRFVSNYVNSFSSDFLFLKGDENVRHGFGNHGLLYLADFIFIAIGLFAHFSDRSKNKLGAFFFWSLLLSPIPYALTRDTDTPHATRLILMLPSVVYFSYLGIKHLQQKYKKSIYLVAIIYCLSFFNFWHYYYYHYPQESAMSWDAGMGEAVVATNGFSNNTLVFSDSYVSFVSFFLYYHPYALSSNSSITDHLKQTSNTSFSGQVLDNKYYFGHINWTNLSNFPKNTIYIIPSSEYDKNFFNSYKTIKFISKKNINQEEFYILTNQ